MKKYLLTNLLSIFLVVSTSFSKPYVLALAQYKNINEDKSNIEDDLEPIFINDELEESKQCEEEDKSIIKKKLFINFNNKRHSTKEHSWFFKPNNKGLPPEEPEEVIELLKNNEGYYLGNTKEKELYLTFDEGYENGYTNDILDILKKHDIKAAFFVVEPYLKSNPDIIKRMADEGHLVCNHSAHHPSMANIKDFEKFKKELGEVEDLYKEITGRDMTKYFRPPMGRYSELSLHYTKELGYKSIFWSLAYYDWDPKKQPNPEESKKKLLQRSHNGAIILLHAVSKTNKNILDDLLTAWKEEGYSFKTLDQLSMNYE